jgi:hypothetical protein
MEVPTGGLNTRDSLDNMPERDAIVLQNWTPDLGSLRVRGGRREHTDSNDINGHTGGHVESLMVYESGSAKQLLAAEYGAEDTCVIYNATSIGAPGDPVLKDGISIARLNSVNFEGKLIVVGNGMLPQTYDGEDMTDLSITGVGWPRSDVVGINIHKDRVFYWIANSQDVWYTNLYTPGAAVAKFPLSYVASKGGRLVHMATWTQDGGSGPDDLAVFFMSSGEVIIYRGSSPAAYADWALIGRYDIGVPLSDRSIVKFGKDIIVSTEFDYVYFSEIIQGEEARQKKTKITGALKQAVIDYGTNWGWCTALFSAGKLGIFNVPITTNSKAMQHVVNLITGAWTTWTGHNANCWVEFNGKLYFGGAGGKVYQAEYQYDDEGSPIQSVLQTAWNKLKYSSNKRIIGLHEHYRAGSAINISNEFATDYGNFPSQGFPSETDSVGTNWGSDWGSVWSSGGVTYNNWNLAYGNGRVVSMQKKLQTKQLVEWFGMTWLYEKGFRL